MACSRDSAGRASTCVSALLPDVPGASPCLSLVARLSLSLNLGRCVHVLYGVYIYTSATVPSTTYVWSHRGNCFGAGHPLWSQAAMPLLLRGGDPWNQRDRDRLNEDTSCIVHRAARQKKETASFLFCVSYLPAQKPQCIAAKTPAAGSPAISPNRRSTSGFWAGASRPFPKWDVSRAPPQKSPPGSSPFSPKLRL